MTNDATTPISLMMLLKPAEAAQMLAISPRKLWSLTNCGAIRCVRIDKAVRYDSIDLRAYIESRKAKARR